MKMSVVEMSEEPFTPDMMKQFHGDCLTRSRVEGNFIYVVTWFSEDTEEVVRVFLINRSTGSACRHRDPPGQWFDIHYLNRWEWIVGRLEHHSAVLELLAEEYNASYRQSLRPANNTE